MFFRKQLKMWYNHGRPLGALGVGLLKAREGRYLKSEYQRQEKN
jgi:hypothetical protein